MRTYTQRIATFENVWQQKDKRLHPERLALMGFYYTGVEDKIKCAYCSLTLCSLQSGPYFFDPLLDHIRYFPECPFVYENLQTPAGYVNTCLATVVPTNLDLTKMEDRLGSFSEWPTVLRNLSFEMCLAGFFYTGKSDRVQCFLCKVEIGEWSPNDVPWHRHYHHSPFCQYLLLNYPQQSQTVLSTLNLDVSTAVVEKDTLSFTADSSAPRLSTVEHENNWRLPQCVTCRMGYISCVFIPCYHLCVCEKCAASTTECPVCQAIVTGVLKVHIPVRHLSTTNVSKTPE